MRGPRTHKPQRHSRIATTEPHQVVNLIGPFLVAGNDEPSAHKGARSQVAIRMRDIEAGAQVHQPAMGQRARSQPFHGADCPEVADDLRQRNVAGLRNSTQQQPSYPVVIVARAGSDRGLGQPRRRCSRSYSGPQVQRLIDVVSRGPTAFGQIGESPGNA